MGNLAIMNKYGENPSVTLGVQGAAERIRSIIAAVDKLIESQHENALKISQMLARILADVRQKEAEDWYDDMLLEKYGDCGDMLATIGIRGAEAESCNRKMLRCFALRDRLYAVPGVGNLPQLITFEVELDAIYKKAKSIENLNDRRMVVQLYRCFKQYVKMCKNAHYDDVLCRVEETLQKIS